MAAIGRHCGVSGRLLAALGGCAALLVGCSANTDELQGWMDQQRREAKPKVAPLEPPKRFDPQPYAAQQSVDPFSGQKLTVELKFEARQPSSLVSAELARRKEPLESYTLDGMRMVGSVVRQGKPYALLMVDKLIYQVKVGDYLGQNYGRITRIDETAVQLREIVQDATGEWIERPASLQLQERQERTR